MVGVVERKDSPLDGMFSIKPSPRVETLKAWYAGELPTMSVERERITVRVTRETEGEPMVVRRAKVFAEVVRKVPSRYFRTISSLAGYPARPGTSIRSQMEPWLILSGRWTKSAPRRKEASLAGSPSPGQRERIGSAKGRRDWLSSFPDSLHSPATGMPPASLGTPLPALPSISPDEMEPGASCARGASSAW